jgi:hypothetical protein
LQADRDLLKEIIGSLRWREFETLSQLSVTNSAFWNEAEQILRQSSRLTCSLPVTDLLTDRPTCFCGFRLTRDVPLGQLVRTLDDVVSRGLDSHRRTVDKWRKHLAIALEHLIDDGMDPAGASHAHQLATSLSDGELPQLSVADVELFESALHDSAVPPLRVSYPEDGYGLMTRDELGARLKQWFDDLPSYPALVDVVSEGQGNGG